MISYWEDYGQDIDGNRGLKVLRHEVTDEDTADIRDEIFNNLREDKYSYTDSMMITLSFHMGGEVDFEVEISEYITESEFDKVQNNI